MKDKTKGNQTYKPGNKNYLDKLNQETATEFGTRDKINELGFDEEKNAYKTKSYQKEKNEKQNEKDYE